MAGTKKTVTSALPAATRATAAAQGLHVSATRGDGSVLLAMNFDQAPASGFAGFSIQCTPPGGKPFYLKNRLSFNTQVTSATPPAQKQAMLTDTDAAPYQKFCWLDFSSTAGPGTYTYTVSAMYHKANKTLEARATAAVSSHNAASVSLDRVACAAAV